MSNNSLSENIFAVASFQGQLAYSIFSIHVVNPGFLIHHLGFNPANVLFLNMLYGNGMHIYSRQTMRRLRLNYRILFSVYGSFVFNYSSALVFFWIRESYYDEKRFGAIVSFFFAKFMYYMFYSYLYFVDRCCNPGLRRDSILDVMFDEDN